MHKYTQEVCSLLKLSIPIIFAQISQTAMSVIDTIMAGSVSTTDMAAVAIGTSFWLSAILFGHGLLLALTSVVAQLNGSGQRDQIPHQIQQGFWLGLITSVLVMGVLYNSKFLIAQMPGIDPLLTRKAVEFLHAILWGAPGYLFFQVLRNQCEGLSKTIPGMVIGFIGLLMNIPINYIFIYGKWGAPALGGVGCGIATAAVYWVMFLLIRGYVKYANVLCGITFINPSLSPDWQTIKRLTELGLPIALAWFFEVTSFTIVTLLVSQLGVIAVAGHQIAINFSSLTFILPMSLSVAATIRVSYRLGQGSVMNAWISAWSSLFVGLVLAGFTMALIIIFRQHIALLYNATPAVAAVASHLMLLAAIYQISDAMQVIGGGVLRGYKDTRSIFFITFTAYWLLGLPSGYLLALTDYVMPAMGPGGFWVGFIIGLTTAAIMIISRVYWIQKQPAAFILQRCAH